MSEDRWKSLEIWKLADEVGIQSLFGNPEIPVWSVVRCEWSVAFKIQSTAAKV